MLWIFDFQRTGAVDLLTVSVRLFVALICGGIIGIERERKQRPAGFRTHILICIGAAMTTLTSQYIAFELGAVTDLARLGAQVIAGIGFIGAGTIIVTKRKNVKGLTTAAGLWATAAIGLALGAGFYAGALITFVFIVLSVTIFHRLEYKITKRYNRFGIYVEIGSDEFVRTAIDSLCELYPITDIQVTPPRSGKAGNVGLEGNVHITSGHHTTPDEVAKRLEELDFVIFALESI